MKLKLKPSGVKLKEHNVGLIKNMSFNEVNHILDNNTECYKEQSEVKKKIKVSPKKVVYISKRGGKAIFDSVHLCAKIFGKDESTIRHRIEHPNAKTKNYDWLKGGKLEYYNNN